MIVVADTGPLNYLILSGQIALAHELYGALLIPKAVQSELLDPRAPLKVREWASALPVWAKVRKAAVAEGFVDLGPGEAKQSPGDGNEGGFCPHRRNIGPPSCGQK
jgi:predicted nucleic acid-binding protein